MLIPNSLTGLQGDSVCHIQRQGLGIIQIQDPYFLTSCQAIGCCYCHSNLTGLQTDNLHFTVRVHRCRCHSFIAHGYRKRIGSIGGQELHIEPGSSTHCNRRRIPGFQIYILRLLRNRYLYCVRFVCIVKVGQVQTISGASLQVNCAPYSFSYRGACSVNIASAFRLDIHINCFAVTEAIVAAFLRSKGIADRASCHLIHLAGNIQHQRIHAAGSCGECNFSRIIVVIVDGVSSIGLQQIAVSKSRILRVGVITICIVDVQAHAIGTADQIISSLLGCKGYAHTAALG